MTLEQALLDKNLNITSARLTLFKLLKNIDRPLSISEIIYQLPRFDRSTIYRSIDAFEKIEIIKKVWFGDKYKIELSDEFNKHHHHIVCKKCSLIEKIDYKNLENIMNNIVKKHLFTSSTHHIEIIGLCKNCR